MEEERFARLNHRDSETSLDPTHFRLYASDQGRWLSPDLRQGQALNPQSFNRYSYVLGNPANRIDPRGLCGCYPGYDEFDYLLDFGFVPDYGNYGCGCSPFGCGYPLLPPIGVVVFGGGGAELRRVESISHPRRLIMLASPIPILQTVHYAVRPVRPFFHVAR